MRHSLSRYRNLAAWLLIGMLSACVEQVEQRGVYAGVTYLRLQGGLFVWDLPDLSRVEVVPSVLPGVNELVVLDGYGWYKIRFTVFKPMLPGGAHVWLCNIVSGTKPKRKSRPVFIYRPDALDSWGSRTEKRVEHMSDMLAIINTMSCIGQENFKFGSKDRG